MNSPARCKRVQVSKVGHAAVPQIVVPAILLTFVLAFVPLHSHAQDVTKRKLVDHAAPLYPALARSIALAGSVKVEAVVEPDGSVKTVEIKGGHPVLAQAAVGAVLRWKWEPATRESREVIEIKFAPE